MITMKFNTPDMNPVKMAAQVRHNYGVKIDSPINLSDLLRTLNIKLIYDDLGSYYLGSCATKGLKRVVVINECLKNQNTRERFTIGHEIGHIVLHHGKRICSKYDFNELKLTYEIENEANQFSSELLLPHKAVMEYLKKKDISIKLIIQISKIYGCSLTSTAIKLVKLSEDPVAVFLHDNGKINWSVKSLNCKYIPVEGDIGFSSKIISFDKSDMIKKGYVDNEKWFTNVKDEDKCYEETIHFSKLNKTLTIVKVEESYDY